MASSFLTVPIPGLSLLDRLASSGGYDGQPESDRECLDVLRKCLLRDISNLLNARRPAPLIDDRSALLARHPADGTIAMFGLPDMTCLDLRSPRDLEAARNWLEATLRAYESRLTDLRVHASSRDGRAGRTTFWVEARIRARRTHVPLSFDVAVSWRSRSVEVG